MKKDQRSLHQRGGAVQVILLVVGGLLLLVVVAVLVGLWAARRYVQIDVDRGGDSKRVEIRTPIGEVSVEKAADAAARLKLPVYPGAEPEEEGVSVRLWGRIENEEGGLDVTAAEFRARDSFDRVDAWYREQLGSGFTREQGRIVGGDRPGQAREWEIRVEPGGSDILYKQETTDRVRCVVLKQEGNQVKIGLFEVAGRGHQ